VHSGAGVPPAAPGLLDPMPEGDTIYRTADTLRRVLAGRVVTVFESQLPQLTRVDEDAPIVGRTVVDVRAVGKHLLIELSGDLVLRTHLRMHGAWHVYRPGERWRRGRQHMRIVLGTGNSVAVGFDIPVAELLDSRALERSADLNRLGPDLLGEAFDVGEAVARLKERPQMPVGDALLDQNVMAGVGNVFKSETLFVCRISPLVPIAKLRDEQLESLVRTARELLGRNAKPGRGRSWFRQTTRSLDPSARFWVYGRTGRPCRQCGTPIVSRLHGSGTRRSYWCPRCQGQALGSGL
jgi:endonuclease VIII